MYIQKNFRDLKIQSRPMIIAFVFLIAILFVTFGGYTILDHFPDLGAQGADILRKIYGDNIVANLENIIYSSQDAVTNSTYHFIGNKPASPWKSIPADTIVSRSEINSVSNNSLPNIESKKMIGEKTIPVGTQIVLSQPVSGSSSTSSLEPLQAFGSLSGEGQWLPYIQDLSGNNIAYRTFLQPDTQRPYALPAIVAFNLEKVKLHFVLGSFEPQSSVRMDRPGAIPKSDLKSGLVIAAFNGGFQAQHGHFGVMANGVVLIPPKPDLGTVALYSNGSVRIGAWGSDIVPDPSMVFWRQNGPLIIQNGIRNLPTPTSNVWSFTVSDMTPIWRSGLGISKDGRTLYYVAGPSLTVSALADTMARIGVSQAMQLDINKYWVHFDEIKMNRYKSTTSPLMDGMQRGVGRFFSTYSRDFFYLTAN